MYSYSFNQEVFKGEYDTKEEALDNAKIQADTFGLSNGDNITIYVGKNVYPYDVLENYDICYHIITRLDDVVYDEIPFDSCDDFFTLDDDKQTELNSIIMSYIKEHAKYPNFFTVKNISVHTYIIGEQK
jgi:hypothetical protein